jgi:DNA replication and repair protein RecF
MVEQIILAQVRSIERTSLSFSEKTIVSGRNGVGKTTLFEALHTTSWGRSFRTACLHEVIQDTATKAQWRIAGTTGEAAWQYTTCITRDGRKTTDRTGKRIESCRAIWPDILPIVHWSDRQMLISGPPLLRRSFLSTAAVLSAEGRELYKAYHAVHRQRLALIKKSRRYDLEADRPWVSLFWHYGSALRVCMQQEFARIIAIAQRIAPFSLSARYIQEDPLLSIQDLIEYHLTKAAYEYSAQKVIMGPHRDEIQIDFQGTNARSRASRGQQRLSALVLDAALAQYAAEEYGYPVIFVADDFLSDLDRAARASAWEIMERLTIQRVVSVIEGEQFPAAWDHAALK